jgi:hypothetical protein
MEQSEEAEDVVTLFNDNRRHIGWQAKQIACHLGDPTLSGVQMWCQDTVAVPYDVALCIARFAWFIHDNPMPIALPRARGIVLPPYQRQLLYKQFKDDVATIRLWPKQLSKHVQHTHGAVGNWYHGSALPPTDVLDTLHLWAEYIRNNPFPQYRKGTHGGARYKRTTTVGASLHVPSSSQG